VSEVGEAGVSGVVATAGWASAVGAVAAAGTAGTVPVGAVPLATDPSFALVTVFIGLRTGGVFVEIMPRVGDEQY
jgi:phosphoribosylcarboxyaminoimidazole (NCAIR) mutase